VIVDTECPRCDGTGRVQGTTPTARSRYVRYDDLDPDDFGSACPNCGGIGVVSSDPADEIEDWMRDE
jgi:RecJ-like exonuclease